MKGEQIEKKNWENVEEKRNEKNILSIETKMPLMISPVTNLSITGRPVIALMKSSGF
jgi:hypothetical protein